MAITSASTFAQIEAQYVDNANYDVNASTSECGLFIHACRTLLLKLPEETRAGGESTRFSAASIRAALDSAKRWLAANNTSTVPTVVFAKFDSSFRG